MGTRFLSACAGALMLTLSACASGGPLQPEPLDGLYLLRSHTDGSVVSGQLELRANGEVERTLVYGDETYVWTGRYRMTKSGFEIALWMPGTAEPEMNFRPATYGNGVVVIRYGAPADGSILEVYDHTSSTGL